MNKKLSWKIVKKRLTRLTRPVRQWLSVPLIQGLCFIAQHLSHRRVLALGRVLGVFAWLISPYLRKLAQRQLLETGVAVDKRQARRLCRQVFESISMNMLEWLHSLKWDDETYRHHVQFDRPELMKEALQRGQGLIMISGHMGNWELMVRCTCAWFDTPAAGLMAETRNHGFNKWLIRQREACGSKMLPSRAPVISMVRHLKRGGVLAMLVDQDSRRNRGDFIDFFGKPAFTPMGPGHLAYRTGLPVLPVSIARMENDPTHHVIHVGDPITIDLTADMETAILKMTQDITAYLEQRIRAYPGQWVWIHERWRHRPGQKIKVRSV